MEEERQTHEGQEEVGFCFTAEFFEAIMFINRRYFLASLLLVVSPTLAAKRKKFRFKIKTKEGNIVSNILIEGKDIFDAQGKLQKRYPECKVLEAKEE